LAALVKLAMLVLMALWLLHPDSLLIYAAWALGNACSLLIIVPLVLRRSSGRALMNCWQFFTERWSPSLKHHILNLSLDAPSQIMPVLVTVLLSTTANAWFAMSSLLSNFVFGALAALTIVLCATGSARPVEMAARIRFSLSISLLICCSANLVFLFAASRVLAVFGPGYAEQARWCLQLLGLGTFPCIIRTHYVAIHRIRGTMATAIAPIIVSGVFELVCSALGAHQAGLTGLSLGLLLAYCVEAVLMGKTVYAVVVPTPVLHPIFQPIPVSAQP
jgi:O-antigen/teichoic acid export membrane protein